MPANCTVCNRLIQYQEDVRCAQCGSLAHMACTSTGGRNSTWVCCNFSTPNSKMGTGTLTNFVFTEEHFKNLMCQLLAINKNVQDSNALLKYQGEQLSVCIKEIELIKTENYNLKQKILLLEDQLHDTRNTENSYREIRDRIKRENNIMLFGLSEEISVPNSFEDHQLATKVISVIAPDATEKVIECTRIGKFAGRPRPLKVSFCDSKISRMILVNKKKLLPTEYHNIKIQADLTKNQLQHLKSLQKELKTRQDQGERNITIKYVNQSPQIVQLDEDSKRRGEGKDATPEKQNTKIFSSSNKH
uniref:Phorbol-ester/DAG-type domain-containing protein n=1 Tax=Photinus pyralis TaxID=7054 RepID=A0A1Y1MUD6_PHOPY